MIVRTTKARMAEITTTLKGRAGGRDKGCPSANRALGSCLSHPTSSTTNPLCPSCPEQKPPLTPFHRLSCLILSLSLWAINTYALRNYLLLRSLSASLSLQPLQGSVWPVCHGSRSDASSWRPGCGSPFLSMRTDMRHASCPCTGIVHACLHACIGLRIHKYMHRQTLVGLHMDLSAFFITCLQTYIWRVCTHV